MRNKRIEDFKNICKSLDIPLSSKSLETLKLAYNEFECLVEYKQKYANELLKSLVECLEPLVSDTSNEATVKTLNLVNTHLKDARDFADTISPVCSAGLELAIRVLQPFINHLKSVCKLSSVIKKL